MARSDPREAVDRIRDRLQKGERGDTEAARELLLDISDNIALVPSKAGDYRHRDILRHGAIIAENVGGDTLVAALEDRDAAEEIVRWINREYENVHTNKDYRRDLRAIGRYADQITDDPPESLAWIPTDTPNDFNPRPSERDLITYDEMRLMLEETSNARDEALIILQFEAGLRSGELQDLTIGDVFDSEHSMAVHVDGKQGERVVHLVVAVPYLNRWLAPDRHPGFGDPEAPLWSKLDRPETISSTMVYKTFRRAARAADVNKDATPTNFRKSNTRWLTRLGMDRGKIEQRQGRVPGSEHTARYEAEFGDESLEHSYAALHGEDVETDDSGLEVAPVICPRCQKPTPQELDFCIHCRQTLDPEAQELVETVARGFEDQAIAAEDPTEAQRAIEASRKVRSEPNHIDRDDLHQLASRLSDE
ncbi:tyrosine-type recombinase/integrase [Halobellus rubicundus]|uniref:Tyrosine-type recombinase/integrase n=1 Tax=Halobellus rubicundus TaxID=2996466 RepID=A0ABD5MGM6_9EURY